MLTKEDFNKSQKFQRPHIQDLHNESMIKKTQIEIGNVTTKSKNMLKLTQSSHKMKNPNKFQKQDDSDLSKTFAKSKFLDFNLLF